MATPVLNWKVIRFFYNFISIKIFAMKKMILGSFLVSGLLFASESTYAGSNNNGNKPQVETGNKSLEPSKYTFTLFNFFTTPNQAADSTRLPTRNNPKGKKQEE
jgi:hypothetical protein